MTAGGGVYIYSTLWFWDLVKFYKCFGHGFPCRWLVSTLRAARLRSLCEGNGYVDLICEVAACFHAIYAELVPSAHGENTQHPP